MSATGEEDSATTPPPLDRKPTQVKHPWRATVRTGLVSVTGLIPLIPQIAATAGISHVPIVAQTVAIAIVITRVMAMPEVERWLRTYIPWLSATEPYNGNHRKDTQ